MEIKLKTIEPRHTDAAIADLASNQSCTSPGSGKYINPGKLAANSPEPNFGVCIAGLALQIIMEWILCRNTGKNARRAKVPSQGADGPPRARIVLLSSGMTRPVFITIFAWKWAAY